MGVLYFTLSLLSFCFPVHKGGVIAKPPPVLCVHLMEQGGDGFGKPKGCEIADSEIEGHFSRLTDRLLNHIKSLIQAKFQLRTARFCIVRFDHVPLTFKGWALQW